MEQQNWKQRMIAYINALDNEKLTVGISEKIIRGLQNIAEEEYKKEAAYQKAEADLEKTSISRKDLISLYRELFYGRQDVFALRWENQKTGASGYSPKCQNEWVRGVCMKKQGSKACKSCAYRDYQPLTDEIVQQHFTSSGKNAVVLGLYPLLEDESCRFLAIDFDKENWKQEILSVKKIYREYGIEAYVERSRSGNGGHLWVFFAEKVEAQLARQLGMKILETAIARDGKVKFQAFDRMFPNQDRMPQGGFGNLIALPLQRMAVEKQNGVFIDDNFEMYPSQTRILQEIRKFTRAEVMECLKRFPNVILEEISSSEIEEEDKDLPWVRKSQTEQAPDDLPERIEVLLYDKLYISRENLHPFLNRKLRALAIFRNPEYYTAKNMRKSLVNIPVWIQCFEETQDFLILPIGCLEPMQELCGAYHVAVKDTDKRFAGQNIEVEFYGDLREKQIRAVEELLSHDNGILHANTAFGKTVAALALIAERKVNTLIIVDRVQLMEQWKERVSVFLNMPIKEIGTIGGGKKKVTGKVDIAVCQSLYRNHEVSDLIKGYGQVIVDECHHVSAVGFEEILKSSPAKYKHGLTATLKRKDGKDRIVLMQLGPVRYKDLSKVSSELEHKVYIRKTGISGEKLGENSTANDLYQYLYQNPVRNEQIIMDIKNSLDAGRCPIVLTERKEHIELLAGRLSEYARVYKLTGGGKRKEKAAMLEELFSLEDTEKRVILATSRYIGEGFDYPILDTLFLTLPVSWSGRIKQYAGRLHREYHEKKGSQHL